MEIRFLGHACFEFTHGDAHVLVDPFLTGNPKAAAAHHELDATHILLTHGHGDHIGDTEEIAKRTGAVVVAVPEITNELSRAGVENVRDPNLGGTVKFDWGWVKLVPAWHTSTTPRGSSPGTAAGLLIGIGGKTVYHLGDTALFSDMKLIASRGNPIDVALVPIGGHYTMDRLDAVVACELIGAAIVIPCHYDTFPPIETNVQAFKSDVEAQTSSKVFILEPGQTLST